MRALKTKGFTVKWFDKRKSVDEIDLDSLFGLIVNQNKSTLFSLWNSRHWIAIPNIDGKFYDSNSTHSKPKEFGSQEEVI